MSFFSWYIGTATIGGNFSLEKWEQKVIPKTSGNPIDEIMH
jgi:hypothetical protein